MAFPRQDLRNPNSTAKMFLGCATASETTKTTKLQASDCDMKLLVITSRFEVDSLDLVSNLLITDAELISEHNSRGHVVGFANLRKMFDMPAVHVTKLPDCGHCKVANIKAARNSRKAPSSTNPVDKISIVFSELLGSSPCPTPPLMVSGISVC